MKSFTDYAVVTLMMLMMGAPMAKSNSRTAEQSGGEQVLVPQADRNPPEPVEPLVMGEVKFSAPSLEQGVLVAVEAKSGRPLWKIRVVDYYIHPDLEADVQDTYIVALREFKANPRQIEVTDERGLRYLVDTKTGKIIIPEWPVKLKIIEAKPAENKWRYFVEIQIENTLNRDMKLDRPSVAYGGSVSNDIFRVTLDGKPVKYMGNLLRRAPPIGFETLKPGQTYQSKVGLGESYPIPLGKHTVGVSFESKNLFSSDSFLMKSNSHERVLEGEGFKIEKKPPSPK